MTPHTIDKRSVSYLVGHRDKSKGGNVKKVRGTEYTEWHWPLSGVHSMMRVKSAQAGEGGGARPPSFTMSSIVYHHTCTNFSTTVPIFLLYPYIYYVVRSGTIQYISAWGPAKS